MNYKEIDLLKAEINPFNSIGKNWFLISAGDEKGLNTMTASWGGMGVMWHKNVVTVVVRPQRKTLEFLNSNDLFTVSFYDEKYRDILKFCGANSGQNVDKISATGLTPVFMENTVTFEQASQTFFCKKLYVQKLEPECFVDKDLLANYPANDYHFAIVGEIVKAIEKE